MTIRRVYQRLSDCMWTFLAVSLEELITRDPPGQAHFQVNCEENVAGGLERQNLMLCGEVNLYQSTHRQGRGRRNG
jgi:hypothetical protein